MPTLIWRLVVLLLLGTAFQAGCSRRDERPAGIPFVIRLQDADAEVRCRALDECLGRGGVPLDALPYVVKQLNDSNSILRVRAAKVLKFVGKEGVPYLSQMKEARSRETDIDTATELDEAIYRFTVLSNI